MTWWSGRRRRSKFVVYLALLGARPPSHLADASLRAPPRPRPSCLKCYARKSRRVWRPLRRWRGGCDSVPGGSVRCRAARTPLVAADLRPLGRSYTAEGSRLDLNFACSIAPCTLMRELWACKGRLSFYRGRQCAGPGGCEACHKSGARAPISALEYSQRTGTVVPLCCASATPATPRRLAPNSRKPAARSGERSRSARRIHAAAAPSAARTAPHSTKGHNPEFRGAKSSLTRRRRVAVNPRREEAKIAA